MSAAAGNKPAWLAKPPELFDIVAVYFPENANPDEPGLKLRPGLVVKIYRGKTSGLFYCDVAYGTKRLKLMRRRRLDLIIQNADHVQQLGLARATRFDLDRIAEQLPWSEDFFGCWSGYSSPIISPLTENYIKNFAFLMMKRGLKKPPGDAASNH